MLSDGASGLRARDVASLQANLRRQEAEMEEQRSLREPARITRRLSNQSSSSQHRPVVNRQMSDGMVKERNTKQREDPRARRALSNASLTSTVLSAGRQTTHTYDSLAGGKHDKSDLPRPAKARLGGTSRVRLEDSKIYDSPVRRWCRFIEKTRKSNTPAEKAKEWAIALASIVWIKWAVGLGGWSGGMPPAIYASHCAQDAYIFLCTPGKGYPPLYGDMEAQRHWLSIVKHIPLSRWYYHDLAHWGLDYPPLTAYHSLLLAKIAEFTGNSPVVELRGRLLGKEIVYAEEKAVLYMRSTVIIGDLLLWALPVAIWCALTLGRLKGAEKGGSKRSARTLASLLYSEGVQSLSWS